MQTMQIAILSCNQFSVAGGAERLVIDMARALNADVITPSYNEKVIRNYDSAKGVRMISLNKPLPDEPYRQIAGMRIFSRIDLD
jgi:hypothetical protein